MNKRRHPKYGPPVPLAEGLKEGPVTPLSADEPQSLTPEQVREKLEKVQQQRAGFQRSLYQIKDPDAQASIRAAIEAADNLIGDYAQILADVASYDDEFVAREVKRIVEAAGL